VHIRVQTEDNQIFDRDSPYVKNLDDQNGPLMQSLDGVLRPLFAAKLDAKNRDTSYIRNACFVGGYLGVLGRGVFLPVERPQVFINGVSGGSVPSLSIGAHVKYLMLCKIFHLTEDILMATRMTENAQSPVAYAAAVILDFELRSFESFSRTEAFTALQVRSTFYLRYPTNASHPDFEQRPGYIVELGLRCSTRTPVTNL
jgi:hypothetical protein